MAEDLPPPGGFVTSDLRDLFNSRLKQLMSDLGRSIEVFFQPSASGCPNCLSGPDGSSNGVYNTINPFPAGQFNKPFARGSTCPVCRGSHKIYTKQSAIYTVLREWNPEDFNSEAIGEVGANIVSTKAVIEAKEDFNRAVKAELEGVTLVRITAPVPAGLAPPKFVRVFWKKQD